MNYKWFFKRVWRLLVSPTKTWEEIAGEDPEKNFFSDFFYPLTGFCGMLLFSVTLFRLWMESPEASVNLMVQESLMDTAEVFIAFIGGFFFSIWVIRESCGSWLDLSADGHWLPLLTGYSMTVPILLQTVAGIIDSFALLQWAFQFYTLYLVWEGSKKVPSLKEEKRLSFSLLTALALIAIPHLISFAFGRLTHILH